MVTQAGDKSRVRIVGSMASIVWYQWIRCHFSCDKFNQIGHQQSRTKENEAVKFTVWLLITLYPRSTFFVYMLSAAWLMSTAQQIKRATFSNISALHFSVLRRVWCDVMVSFVERKACSGLMVWINNPLIWCSGGGAVTAPSVRCITSNKGSIASSSTASVTLNTTLYFASL